MPLKSTLYTIMFNQSMSDTRIRRFMNIEGRRYLCRILTLICIILIEERINCHHVLLMPMALQKRICKQIDYDTYTFLIKSYLASLYIMFAI